MWKTVLKLWERKEERGQSATLVLLVLFSIFSFPLSAFASTFHISSSLGSDANTSTQAQQTCPGVSCAPWAHVPGMKNATGIAASYTPQPGDRFIFYGGDTWTVASFQWHIAASGTEVNPIYYGVDHAWYKAGSCGASFCQPVFDFQNTIVSSSCSGYACAGIWVSANYLTLDQLTLKHFEFPNNLVRTAYRGDMIHGADTGSSQTNNGITFSGDKFLDWGMEGTVGAGSDNASVISGGFGAASNSISGVLLDDAGGSCGSPTTNCFTDGGAAAGVITGSECRNTNNCFNTGQSTISYNSIHDIKLSTDPNDHENAIHAFCSATIYGNHLYNIVAGASPILNEQLNWCPTGGTENYYTFDNLIDETGGNQPCEVDRNQHQGSEIVNYYHYNDTCIPSGSGGNSSYAIRAQTDTTVCANAIAAINLHVISQGWSGNSTPLNYSGTAGINPVVYVDGGCTSPTQISVTTSVPMSPSTATAQGYTATNGYQPTARTNATVGQGTNETAVCSGSLANLCYALNFTNLTVPGTSRPPAGKWDVGAYQSAIPSVRPVLPPPNLVLGAH